MLIDKEGLMMHEAIFMCHRKVSHTRARIMRGWTRRLEGKANADWLNAAAVDQMTLGTCHARVSTGVRHYTFSGTVVQPKQFRENIIYPRYVNFLKRVF